MFRKRITKNDNGVDGSSNRRAGDFAVDLRRACHLISEQFAYIDISITLVTPTQVLNKNDKQERDTQRPGQPISPSPPVRIEFQLSNSYPSGTPPLERLTSALPCIPDTILSKLAADAVSLWENGDHSEILFAYVLHVQEAVQIEFAFKQLTVSPELSNQLVNFHRQAAQEDFDESTFECEICLGVKKGSASHRMEQCGHMFCVECLQQGFNNAIISVDVLVIQGPPINYGTENDEPQIRRAKKVRLMAPSDLLCIPIERPAVQRYVDMKRKKQLESDPSTIWCPRKWYKSIAVDNKYPKLGVPLEAMVDIYQIEDERDDDSASPSNNSPGEEEEEEEEEESVHTDMLDEDRLQVCSDCSFAFCTIYLMAWHGDYFDCRVQVLERAKVRKEDKASKEYITKHSVARPKCKTRTQKARGYNHLRFGLCSARFCYLSGNFLDIIDPYQHYHIKGTPCYHRVNGLLNGDGY